MVVFRFVIQTLIHFESSTFLIQNRSQQHIKTFFLQELHGIFMIQKLYLRKGNKSLTNYFACVNIYKNGNVKQIPCTVCIHLLFSYNTGLSINHFRSFIDFIDFKSQTRIV